MDIIKIDDYLFYGEKGVPKEMLLTGYNLSQELEYLEKIGLNTIWVNRAFCGNRIQDLSFLKDYPFIRGLCVYKENINLEGVYNLHQLEWLSVENGKGLHFAEFPELKRLNAKYITDFRFPDKLTELYIWHTKIKGGSLSNISLPRSLKRFDLLFSNIVDCQGLPPELNRLGLSYCRNLTSLNGLETVTDQLTYLELDHCRKLEDYSSLADCVNLQRLLVLDCTKFQNLSFAKEMKKLEFFSFYGTDVLDNDLSPLLHIPKVSFKNKKEYNYSFRDFKLVKK